MSVCACVAYTLAMLISFVLFAWLCQAHKTTISYAVSKYTVVHTCNLSVQTLNMHEIKVSHLEQKLKKFSTWLYGYIDLIVLSKVPDPLQYYFIL